MELCGRLQKIVEIDSVGAIKKTLSVAQTDIMSTLCEFMAVEKMDMTLDCEKDGYKLVIVAKVANIYGIGDISQSE